MKFIAISLFALFTSSAYAMPGLLLVDCKDKKDNSEVSVTLSRNVLDIVATRTSRAATLQNQSDFDATAASRSYTNFGTSMVGQVNTKLLKNDGKANKGSIRLFDDGKKVLDLSCEVTGFQG